MVCRYGIPSIPGAWFTYVPVYFVPRVYVVLPGTYESCARGIPPVNSGNIYLVLTHNCCCVRMVHGTGYTWGRGRTKRRGRGKELHQSAHGTWYMVHDTCHMAHGGSGQRWERREDACLVSRRESRTKKKRGYLEGTNDL